jgi:hypothetical protein
VAAFPLTLFAERAPSKAATEEAAQMHSVQELENDLRMDPIDATPADLAEFLIYDAIATLPQKAMMCASVDGTDPPAALLQLLQQHDTRIVPASECVYVMNATRASFHKPTGRTAFFVEVSAFSTLSDGTHKIKTAIRHHGKWADYKTLEVAKQMGGWTVVKVKAHWVS